MTAGPPRGVTLRVAASLAELAQARADAIDRAREARACGVQAQPSPEILAFARRWRLPPAGYSN